MTELKKQEIWAHMLALPKACRGNGLTDKRIERLKRLVWLDAAFWLDVIRRHNLVQLTIEELKAQDVATYEHCVGNFWGMLYLSAVEKGMIR